MVDGHLLKHAITTNKQGLCELREKLDLQNIKCNLRSFKQTLRINSKELQVLTLKNILEK